MCHLPAVLALGFESESGDADRFIAEIARRSISSLAVPPPSPAPGSGSGPSTPRRPHRSSRRRQTGAVDGRVRTVAQGSGAAINVASPGIVHHEAALDAVLPVGEHLLVVLGLGQLARPVLAFGRRHRIGRAQPELQPALGVIVVIEVAPPEEGELVLGVAEPDPTGLSDMMS